MTVDQSGLTRRRILSGGLLAGIGAATVGLGLLLTPSTAHAAEFMLQGGWRWCPKCQGLFYFGSRFTPHFGRCPAGGQHTNTNSFSYYLLCNPDPSAGGFTGTQPGWRWCQKCQGLAYIMNGVVGRCPSSGSHDHTGSFGYHLWIEATPSVPDQDQWRWCDRCQGFFYGPSAPISRCPQSGPHRVSISLNYALQHD
jgi:hypothetical protein